MNKGETVEATKVVDLHPDWAKHPLVAGAIERSGCDPRKVLENLKVILDDLDHRKSGRSIAELLRRRLAAHLGAPEGGQFRRVLRDLGYQAVEIEAVVNHKAEPLKLRSLPAPERETLLGQVASLLEEGWPSGLVSQHTGVDRGSIHLVQVRLGMTTPLSDHQREVALYAQEHGNRAAGRKFNVSAASAFRWKAALPSRARSTAEAAA